MSLSGISSYGANPATGPRADFLQLRDSFKALGSALDSGDLDGAKQALADFTQALQDLPGRRGDKSQAGRGSRIAEDLQTIDKALQSGDTDAAKKAFEALTKDMQNIRHSRGHHRHQKDGDDQASAGTTGTTASSPTGATGTTGTGTGSVDISV